MPRKRRSFYKRKFNKVMQKKLVMLFVAIILAFVFLVGRITYINAASGDKYTKVVWIHDSMTTGRFRLSEGIL